VKISTPIVVILCVVSAPLSSRAQFGTGAGGGLGPASATRPGGNAPRANFPTQPALEQDQQPAPRIKSETVRIPVRVVVRDTHGRAVGDLSKEDFKLYQDGKQQEIAGFTAVSDASATGVVASSALPGTSKDASNASPSQSTAQAPVTRSIALFFDDTHLYFTDLAQTAQAAQKYIATLQPDDRVAIVTASGHGGTNFITDRSQLLDALQHLQAHPPPGGTIGPTNLLMPCPPPITYSEANAIIDDGSDAVLSIAAGDFARCNGIKLQSADAANGMTAAQARAAAAQTRAAGEQGIDAVFTALERVIRFLGESRGDRIIVLVSPGFMLGRHDASFDDVANLALHSRVVINTLDARGLSVPGQDGVWDNDRFQRQGYGHFEVEQPILEDLADATGGLFIKNNNDFAGALREMSEPPESYYLLSYAPRDLAANGKYHLLKVSLARRSLDTVQARRGFYAPSKLETPEDAAQREIEDALFADDQQRDLPMKFEIHLFTNSTGAQNLVLRADVDPSQLAFDRSGSANHDNLAVALAVFDRDGNYVAGNERFDQMDLKDATLDQLKKTGFYMDVNVDLKPGDYVVRAVARESNSKHIAAQSSSLTVP
jgi:VWFA-related protein